MSIEIKHLTKKYKDQKAVDNISLSINTGEIVGFIGPNGAGKSTTMKVLTGYITNYEGTILINGKNIRSDDFEVKAMTGYLPEHNPLYTDLFVKEYLEFIANVYHIKNKKEKINQIIEKTGLTPEKYKKINALSKGYRQRVGLAAALIHDPEVLILDEPTTGLDPNQIIEIRNLIASLGKEKTVILSTHIMQEVEAICDKVIIINKGKIVVDDNAKNVKVFASNKLFTIEIEFSGQITSLDLQELDEILNIKQINEQKWLVEANEDIREKLFNFSVKKQCAILSMQLIEKNLEDVFRELTQE